MAPPTGFRAAKAKFMSSKISDIHSAPPKAPSRQAAEEEEDEDEMAKRLFQKLREEAEAFGLLGLDEKGRRKVETEKMKQLGARPKKNARIPLKLGGGMARKAEEREAKQKHLALTEGILAPREKSTGKRKRETGPRERGLSASEGIFKNGVLHVTPLKVARKTETKMPSLMGNSRRPKGGKKGPKKKGKGKKKRR